VQETANRIQERGLVICVPLSFLATAFLNCLKPAIYHQLHAADFVLLTASCILQTENVS
jgi:hypothetical protein